MNIPHQHKTLFQYLFTSNKYLFDDLQHAYAVIYCAALFHIQNVTGVISGVP